LSALVTRGHEEKLLNAEFAEKIVECAENGMARLFSAFSAAVLRDLSGKKLLDAEFAEESRGSQRNSALTKVR